MTALLLLALALTFVSGWLLGHWEAGREAEGAE